MTQTLDQQSVVDIPQQDTVLERVLRGAAFLDRVEPRWWEDVDLSLLDIQSGSYCVIGQVKGGYTYTLTCCERYQFLYENKNSFDYGFLAAGYTDEDESLDALRLTACWRNVIRARK